MAVAEACIIKSFKRDYISCNLYYSKLLRLVPVQDKSYKRDFTCKAIRNFYCIIIVFLCGNSICKRLSLSVPRYMNFYMSNISAYLPKDTNLIERDLFPCPRGAKSAPSPALRQRMGRSCFFTLYFLRSPISFFSSLKKLSTSANCW